MNNQSVEQDCIDCMGTLDSIRHHIESNPLMAMNEHLNKYSVVMACGIIERSIKKIIYDRVTCNSEECIKKYLEKNVVKKAINPNYQNIINALLKPFDRFWEQKFKQDMDQNFSQEREHLNSLVDLRNSIAHGGSSTPTIGNIIDYFDSSLKIIRLLDSIVAMQTGTQ